MARIPAAYFPPTKTIYGGHEEIHILPYTIDRTNLFVGRVEKHVYEPSDSPNRSYMSLSHGMQIGAQAGIYNLAAGGQGATTAPWCVGVERRYDEAASMAIYTYTFEGIATDHSIKYVEYELEFTMEQAPIETHPSFQKLNDIFGPYDSLNRLWPPIITEESAAVGLKQQGGGGPVTNPMYGVTSYLVPGCIFRQTFTDTDVDTNFLDNVGTINVPKDLGKAFPNFVGLLSKTAGTRNWMKMAPKVRQHGSCLQITEEWMLSGPRGWLTPVYSAEALKGQQL